MLIIGHRGASGYEPENTLAAFKKAMNMGCHGIELDVQMTKDGELVVIHDHTLDRTTTGTGYVAERELKELQLLDAGSWYGSQFEGNRIPTLDATFEIIPKGTLVNVEIKNELRDQRAIEKKSIICY